MTLPTEEEAKEFLEEADEVARLVQCLAEGTITPEYLDKKIAQKEAVKQTKPKDDDKALAAVGKPKDGGPAATQAGAAKQADADPAAEEARKEELMRKVQELKASHERKLRARVKYEEYVANGGGSGYFTDYNKWDMWCPEDEQDDLINSMTPNNPQFKAMEKDIEERHKRSALLCVGRGAGEARQQEQRGRRLRNLTLCATSARACGRRPSPYRALSSLPAATL